MLLDAAIEVTERLFAYLASGAALRAIGQCCRWVGTPIRAAPSWRVRVLVRVRVQGQGETIVALSSTKTRAQP